jgi:hypothetical protein
MTSMMIKAATTIALIALTTPAVAGPCVTKGAIATAESEKSAKWYALETMVQSVSWSLWPGFLSNGKVEGHTIKNERYKCTGDTGSVTCQGRADFCKN